MFSKACEYALRATLFITQRSGEKKLSVEEIAANIDAPKPFTAKILQQLIKGDVISSAKGPNGGFYLSDKAKNQPAWNVLVAMGESERIMKCVMGLAECSDKKPCPMHMHYKLIKQQLIQLFNDTTIGNLAADMGKRKVFIKNS